MPQATDLTVKKNDGTTNIVYTSVSPSSGDSVPAIWKSQTVGTAPAHQPEFRLTAREASKGAKRALRGTFQYPSLSTNSTTGLTSVVDRISGDVNWVIPKGVPQSDINEAIAQFANIVVASLIVACAKAGYSAT